LRVLLVAFVAFGCGASSPRDEPAMGERVLTITTRVMPGEEAQRCQLFVVQTRAPFLGALRHESTRGVHHVALWRTTFRSIPEDRREAFDCAAAPLPAGSLTGALYAAQSSMGSLALPAGVGLALEPTEIVLVETHMLNASAAPLDAAASVTLETRDAATVTTRAGVLSLSAPFIHLAPSSRGDGSLRCPLAADVSLVSAVATMSARGREFRAFADPAADAPSVVPFYVSDAHPTNLKAPVALAAGTRLRIRCTFDVTRLGAERFQGPSPTDDERCTFSALYFPSAPAVDQTCAADADMVGTGKLSCGATLACADACPSVVGAVADRVDPCIQRCVASSCPGAGRALLDALRCTGEACAASRAACGAAQCR